MSDYHVCGMLLHARPEKTPGVAAALHELEGVELHANEGGRMVVTIEGGDYEYCAGMMTRLACLDGVSSSSLIYHQIDKEELPEEPQP
jgi:nitrate reductase NapD